MNPNHDYTDDRTARMNSDDGLRDMTLSTASHEPVYVVYSTDSPDAWIRAEGDAFTNVRYNR